MVWPRVKEGRGVYHRDDAKCASAGNEKKGRPKKIWLDNSRVDTKGHDMTTYIAESPSVWHMELKAGTILHGGGIRVRNTHPYITHITRNLTRKRSDVCCKVLAQTIYWRSWFPQQFISTYQLNVAKRSNSCDLLPTTYSISRAS